MTTDDPLKEMLIRHEGQVKLGAAHVPYDDKTGARFDQGDTLVGKMTIGIGRNITDVGLTDDEALLLLTNDIERVRCDLNKALPWWLKLDECRRAVLISMAFNMGITGLLKFKQTLAFIEAGKYSEASVAMLQSRWAEQVGPRANELSDMMRTGKWRVDA